MTEVRSQPPWFASVTGRGCFVVLLLSGLAEPVRKEIDTMSASRKFFARTVQPFFLFTGAGTALVGLYAVLPSWAMPNIARLPYLQDYTIIIQHWGIMVGLMGVSMMLAAMIPPWRAPILLYSALEKTFMVWLVLSNARQSFVGGFWVPFALDSTVVIYTIGYFSSCGFHQPLSAQSHQSEEAD